MSANALDDASAQLEAGVLFEDSRIVSIAQLREKMRRLGARRVTKARLAAFRRLYDRTPRPNGRNNRPSQPLKTLAEYAVGVRTPFNRYIVLAV